MTSVNAVGLAAQLSLSKGRISQLVADGTLDGCYIGEGRARQFDVSKSCVALGRKLDPAQMLGNGAATQGRIRKLMAEDISGDVDVAPEISGSEDGGSAYERVRTEKLVEESRKLKRLNAQDEGRFVLADEVHRQVARQIAQEIAGFETVLRDAARVIADANKLDFKVVRKMLIDQWRSHRTKRAADLHETASSAEMTELEKSKDI